MVPQPLLERVQAAVAEHVRGSKGYEVESFVNPFTPADCIAAFAMAKLLTEQNAFDICVAVAPEGHIYGYFFRQFDATILSVHVGYPPRQCSVLDQLQPITGKCVLILEDDVASGTTLRLVIDALLEHQPKSLDLYLGCRKDSQCLEAIPSAIRNVYLAENHLGPGRREESEAEFIRHFGKE